MKKLLFILLACLPLFGMAKDKKDNSNPKYLAGAITMEDGKVTFNHEIKGSFALERATLQTNAGLGQQPFQI